MGYFFLWPSPVFSRRMVLSLKHSSDKDVALGYSSKNLCSHWAFCIAESTFQHLVYYLLPAQRNSKLNSLWELPPYNAKL